MSDRIRTGLAYLIGMVMVAAVASAPTVAQTVDDTADPVFEAAGVSVDKVDGLDATKYTTNRIKRAGKIVATNANGVLPSNIVKPQWRVIQNMPSGFADGVDNVGATTRMNVKHATAQITIPPGEGMRVTAQCPAGSLVVGGGFRAHSNGWLQITDSRPDTNSRTSWMVNARNTSATSAYHINADAICMSADPSWAITTKKK